ncbi:helix-turn-helix domain-containing protein [Nonomuraea sediminis]|uniref:helix-turn-helix domain-containing protein n=1 Tax=Nonomuraea sediminis TaxID=2835864 RepID=UPI001BDC85FA|nr:helix-turn-helix transcriptional regulator [Nonomuraea sediminis]
MTERMSWREIRNRRMAEPGATEAYEAARLAHELGKTVRTMREARGLSQNDLARAAGMTQPTVARFEAGGTIPTLPIIERLANALDADLEVRLSLRTSAA